jgi:hypothetical protein
MTSGRGKEVERAVLWGEGKKEINCPEGGKKRCSNGEGKKRETLFDFSYSLSLLGLRS